MSRKNPPASPAHPRYWHVWLLLLPVTLVAAWIPWPLQRLIGNLLGDLSWLLLRSRRRVTMRNLELCFPQWDASRRAAVGKESFRAAGIALFESSRAWWRSPEALAGRFEFRGLDRLQAAQAQGRGVVLFGAHYMHLEIAGAAASARFALDIIYRPQNSPALEALVKWRRQHIYQWQIDRRDVRAIYKALKANHIVWYTGDQDFGRKQAVFAPFFGVPAATIVAGARFARSNGSVAIGVDFRRDDRNGCYVMEFSEPLAFTGDDHADAAAMNRQIEAGILKAPGQYMWFHRRFKTQEHPRGRYPYQP